MKAVFLYDILSKVLKFEKTVKQENIPVRLIPTPRAFTTDCGICAIVDPDHVETIKQLDIPEDYKIKEIEYDE